VEVVGLLIEIQLLPEEFLVDLEVEEVEMIRERQHLQLHQEELEILHQHHHHKEIRAVLADLLVIMGVVEVVAPRPPAVIIVRQVEVLVA
jgi:hypothetical protein